MEQSVPKRRHIKIQTPGNYPGKNIQHTEHGESLKSRKLSVCHCAPSTCQPLVAMARVPQLGALVVLFLVDVCGYQQCLIHKHVT